MYNIDYDYTKKEMKERIDYLINCGFNEEIAIKIAMFKSSDGLSFAIPSK